MKSRVRINKKEMDDFQPRFRINLCVICSVTSCKDSLSAEKYSVLLQDLSHVNTYHLSLVGRESRLG